MPPFVIWEKNKRFANYINKEVYSKWFPIVWCAFVFNHYLPQRSFSPTIYIINLHSKALNKVFAYNHKQSEWREMAAMKTARAMFGAVVHGGKILVAGGVNEEGLTASCEAYDFAANK